MMQISVPLRTPTWFSRRRLLEEKLSDLHKCSNLEHVKQIHAQILKADLHQDLYVAPKLIAAFSLSRQILSAVNVFNQIPEPNVHCYNALIRAHAQNSQPSHAFAVFFEMQRCEMCPDNFTYPYLLKACIGQSWLPVIQMIHSHIEKTGLYSDIFVPNALIDSYSKCGPCGLTAALNLFTSMEEKDIVTWNSMIGGLTKAGELEKAYKLFDEMPVRDMVSWNTMLDGYTKKGDMDKAFKLFEKMPERNIISWSTMVWGYCKAGDIDMARIMFDKSPAKNIILWTTLISGYAERGLVREASTLYEQMEETRLKPDDATMISILAACAESGIMCLGEKIHASINRSRYKCSTKVSNALIDMYAKCGCLEAAFDVFNGIGKKDVVSWNAMLQGLAVHGHGKKALELFSRMIHEEFEPDKFTLVGLLCACSHAGLVEEGRKYFYSMEKVYGIVPEIEHYGCMMDLLGRGGHLKEAFALLHSMPMEPNAKILGTLLGACRMHNAADLARAVSVHLLKLEPSDVGNYSLLSNIYAQAGDWTSVADVRMQMKRHTGGQKPSGASSIELEQKVYDFTVLDRSHPRSDDIYQMIDRLAHDLKLVGYAPVVEE
ncbi:hypothetical protein QN277_011198 [Acacia crassicarpa]|uniref:Chlororespiratory reduction 4 n=1 Tax=Acacia crassicarpa TaxID=499986 RepID=A0AAE1MY67_9FABA|nr:hypothetical protein QN277_011198 [Acacia crassicarpa]